MKPSQCEGTDGHDQHGKAGVQEELPIVFRIHETNTCADPEAVVVHAEDALAALLAVVCTWRLHLLTLLAEVIAIGLVPSGRMVASCVHDAQRLDFLTISCIS